MMIPMKFFSKLFPTGECMDTQDVQGSLLLIFLLLVGGVLCFVLFLCVWCFRVVFFKAALHVFNQSSVREEVERT